ncbi:MAG: class I SAM-dependent methyltransferase [Thermoleophilia bacterium]
MIRDEVIIREINTLWLPVYPYMADHLLAVSGVRGGRFLDLGPFAGGLALNILRRCETLVSTVIDESELVLRWVKMMAAEGGYASRLSTRRQPIDPIPEADAVCDLVAVRGAFFFLTPTLLREVKRVLRPGGFGWVGGGYGPTTPDDVIAPIAHRSRMLNEAIGKRRISPEDARAMARMAGLEECTRVVTEGGLWLEVRA